MGTKKIWNNVLRMLLAMFGLNLFTACYGPAPYVPHMSLTGKVESEDGKPIANIRYSCAGEEVDRRTSSDGEFFYSRSCDASSVPETITLKFVDTDGPDNGGEFEEKTVTVNLKEQASKPMPMVVKMSLKK